MTNDTSLQPESANSTLPRQWRRKASRSRKERIARRASHREENKLNRQAQARKDYGWVNKENANKYRGQTQIIRPISDNSSAHQQGAQAEEG